MKKFIDKNKIAVIVSLAMLIALPTHFALASWLLPSPEDVKNLIAMAFNGLTSAVGFVLIYLLQALIIIAQYNDFINAPAVTTGWIIVRDVCNMFFILILLVIAFATILRLDGYNWKKDVPRLLMYAVLINFSKTICGLMIDFSQVFMMTFVNAISANGSGNLAIMFQVDKATSLKLDSATGSDSLSYTKLMAGAFAGFIAILITTIMVVAILTMLVMRIVYIWIYVLLSPAAFLLNSFSGGKSYYGQWMKKFTTELIGGPVLAFFLWLALAVANNTNNNITSGKDLGDGLKGFVNGGVELFTNGPFQKYLIVIGLLYGGMQVASQVGGAAGAAAGKAMKRADSVFDRTKKMATAPVKYAGKEIYARTPIGGAVELFKQYGKKIDDGRKARIDESAANWRGRIDRTLTSGKNLITTATAGRLNWSRQREINDAVRQQADASERVHQLQNGGTEKDVVLSGFINNANDFQTAEGAYVRRGDTWFHNNNYVDPNDVRDAAGRSIDFIGDEAARANGGYGGVLGDSITAQQTIARDNEDLANRLRQQERRAENVATWGAGILGAVSAFTGFAPGLMAAGTVLAGTGVKNTIDDVQGFVSGSTATNSNIDENKKKMESGKLNNTEILSILDDITQSAHKRFAAMEIAIEKKLVDQDKVGRLKNELGGRLGGINAENGRFNDRFINKRYNDTLNKNGLAALNDDARAAQGVDAHGQPTVGAQRARVRQEAAIAKGDIKISEVSITDLNQVVDRFINSMKADKFSTEFRDLDASKQQELIRQLTHVVADVNRSAETREKAREKLALVSNIQAAYGQPGGGWNMPALAHFINNMTNRQISGLRDEGSVPAKNAFQQAVVAMRDNQEALSTTIRGLFRGDSYTAQNNRVSFGFENNNDVEIARLFDNNNP